MQSRAHVLLMLLGLLMGVLSCAAYGSDTGPRVIISTDISSGVPDDYQSLVHYLTYADYFDTEGLIASPGAGRKAHIFEVINAYETDYPTLVAHSADYPLPAALRTLAKQGATVDSPAAGYSSATEGSNWIISCADAIDSRPLWILVWGAITDVAQAVHDAPRIKSKIRVYSIGSWNTSQDQNARDYLYNNHTDLWWIESNSTFRGMYVGGDQSGDLGNLTFVEQHVRYHGALGNLYYSKKTDLKMGDSPSVLYLLNGNPDQPTTQHWGGMYRTTGHGTYYWTDLTDAQYREGSYDGAKTVNIWREAYLRDWQARMEWLPGEVNLVDNPSFEVDPIPPTYPHYTTSITAWTANPGSLLNDATGPFYNAALGSIPHGLQVYGKQGAGTLSQNLGGLYHGRSFRLAFHVNNRSGFPPMDLSVTLGSQTLYGPTTISTNPGVFHYVFLGPFQYDSAWGTTLTFHFTNPQGDSTLLLDNVQVLSPQSYAVTYQSDPAAGGTVSGPGNIAESGSPGDSIGVTVTPNPGFSISNVTASNGTIVPITGSQYTLSGVTAATTVTATFAPSIYSVNYVALPPEGGVLDGPASILHAGMGAGDTVTFTVDANPGWLLTDVYASAGIVGHVGGNGYTLSGVTADTTVTATFVPISYTVGYVGAPEAGGVLDGPASINHAGTGAGDTVTFTVDENPGWLLTDVYVSAGVVGHVGGNEYEISVVTADTTVTATFVPISYTVGYEADPEVGGVLDGPANIDYAGTGAGDTVNFLVDANPGWSLTDVYASAGVVGYVGGNEYTLSGVTGGAGKSAHQVNIPIEKSDTGPRVIVSTDIGGDPDDHQSLVHYLMYADYFDTEGLIGSPGTGLKANILEVINAYETDYPNLIKYSADYPSPAALRALAKQGATAPSPAAGYSSATEGSNWIISCADASDSRPLWILVWGAITDVAQAVHDAPRIKSKIRVYSIGSWNTSQDANARNYLYNSHADLWWIESNSTFRGMYVGGDQSGDLGNLTFVSQHVRYHGALGDLYYDKKTDLKMGDSPSVLYLLNGDPNQPTTQHWGGMYRTTGHGTYFWTDRTETEYREGSYDGAKTVNVWRAGFLRDWQARMDWIDGEVNLVNNPSFEADPLPPVWPHYTTTITGWNASAGSLLNDTGGPFYTSNLGSIPNETLLYGIQGAGTLSQDIAGLYHGRSFRLVFHVNNRSAHPPMDLTVTLGSQTLYGPMTIPTNSGVFHYVSLGPLQYDSTWGNTLTFHFTNPQGDSALLLDNVQVLSPQSYTVTYQSDPAAGGTVSGPGNIAQSGSPGDSISVTVTPNPGFSTSNVTASNGTIAHIAGYQYALSGVTAITSVTAFFTANEGEGEVLPEGEGEVLPEGEGEVLPEGEGEVPPEGEGEGEVLPEGEGEVLPEGEGEVLPEGEGEVLPEGEGEVLPEGEGEFDVTVTATFAPISYIVDYVAVPTAGGLSAGPASITHAGTGAGDTISFTVDANTGWQLSGMPIASPSGTVTHQGGNTYLLSNVTENVVVTAVFSPINYTVEYVAVPVEGGLSAGPVTITHTGTGEGDTISFTVDANAGWQLSGTPSVSPSGTVTHQGGNTYLLSNVTENVTVIANFAINQYTLTYTAGSNGLISGATPQTINYGGNGTAVTAVPDTGYHFVEWSDGVLTATRTDTNVTANIDVIATFERSTGTVAVQVTPDTAPWIFLDGDGVPHEGVGDATVSDIPAGQIALTWGNLSGFTAPEGETQALVRDGTVTFTGVYGPVVVFISPPQDQRRYAGNTATFAVTTTGGLGALHYQWWFDDDQKAQTPVGEDSSTLILEGVTLADSGHYWCDVTDEFPKTYSSPSAVLEVGEHVQITQHPLGGDKTTGQSHTFTVGASGGLGALSYLWQKDGETIAEADTESYIILSLTPEDEGSYLAIVFDEVTDVVQSDTAVLNVTTEGLPLSGIAGAVVLLAVFGLGGVLAIQRRQR